MQSRKEQNSHTYNLKANYSKEEKKTRLNEKQSESNLLESIKAMPEDQLIYFMEEKYEKTVNEDQGLEYKVNLLLAQRINSLRQNFLNQEKARYIDFIVSLGGKKLTDAQYEEVLASRSFHNPKNCYISTADFNGLPYYKFQSESNQTANFVLKKLPEKLIYEIETKRARKDGIPFLRDFLEYKAKIQKINNL